MNDPATAKRSFWRHAAVPTVVALVLATLGQFASVNGEDFRPRVATEYLGAELVHRASRTCASGPGLASNCSKEPGNDQVIAVAGNTGAATNIRYDVRAKLASRTDPLGHTTTYSYDAVGNLASESDPDGRTTRYGYDSLDRLTSVTDAIGGVTRYDYDAAGQMIRLTDANGHAIEHTYWPTGRLKTNDYADGSTMSFGYDPVGNLTRRTKRDGTSISYTYDNRNRLRITTLGSGRQIFADYNQAGLLTSVRDSDTGEITYGHDLAQRVTTTNKANGATIDYGHDVAGRVSSLTVGGRSQSWTYDPAGRTATATDFAGQTASLGYDTAGRLATLTRPGAAGTTAISYDDAGRITRVNSGPSLGDFGYDYDSAGNRVAMTETLAGYSDVVDYEYDPLNRLIREARRSGTVNEFSYDAVGNRTRATGQPDREYDALDQVVGWNYDANGNLLADDDATYGFDELDRLTSASRPGSDSSFTWDAEGNLLDQTQNGQTRSLVVDSQSGLARVLQERDPADNAVTASYSYCSTSCTKVISVENSDGHRWTYSDALGSIRTLGDDAGNATDAKTFSAYGTEGPFVSGTNPNPYAFAGERQDGSGLYWNRARFYNPGSGSFISRDRYSGNPYAYADGNPSRFTDPSGHFAMGTFTDASGSQPIVEKERADSARASVSIGARIIRWLWKNRRMVGSLLLTASAATYAQSSGGGNEEEPPENNQRECDESAFDPPDIARDRHGNWVTDKYAISRDAIAKHTSQGTGKSFFDSSMTDDQIARLILTAAHLADFCGLWIDAAKAKVFIRGQSVGRVGRTGDETNYLNIYRKSRGPSGLRSVHGTPGNP